MAYISIKFSAQFSYVYDKPNVTDQRFGYSLWFCKENWLQETNHFCLNSPAVCLSEDDYMNNQTLACELYNEVQYIIPLMNDA